MKKIAIVLVSSTILFSAAYVASARSRGMGDGSQMSGKSLNQGSGHRNTQKRRGHWANQMNLNKEQEEKITEIRRKYQGKLTSKRESLLKARREYHQALRSDAPNKQLIGLHKNMQKLVSELSDLRFKILLETRGVLTPEQRNRMGRQR